MPKEIQRSNKLRNAVIIAVAAGAALALYRASQRRTPPVEPQSSVTVQPAATLVIPETRPAESGIPPYHETAEAAKPFPPLVPAAYFHSTPLLERVYRAAAEIPDVVAQQPCYCYCDKFGHSSLLDCYASDHGAG